MRSKTMKMPMLLIAVGMSLIFSMPTKAEPKMSDPASVGKSEEVAARITMRVGDKVITADLNDSPTSRDFIKSLPLTMKMTRWGNREYYGKVATALSAGGQRHSGFEDGEVSYWAPGGSFAVFFNAKSANQNISDLILMGKITSSLEVFATLDDSVEMRIEAVE